MIRKTVTATITFTLALTICAGAAPQWPRPLLSIPKLPAGQTAESIVDGPPTVERFRFSKLSVQAFQRVGAWLAYDDENLYVAFLCLDSGIGKKTAVSPEGEIVPDDDSVSIMLDVDNDGRTYHMFTVTAGGVKSAEHGRQFIRQPFDADWTAETQKSGDTWTAFLTIPFKSLGVSTPVAGTRWGAQLSRYDPAVKYPAFWARVRKDSREVQRSGEIVFSGADQVSAAISDVRIDVPGWQDAAFHVWNPTDKPITLKVQFTVDGRTDRLTGISYPPISFEREITAEYELMTIPIRFEYDLDGWHDLTITVTDTDGRVLAKSPKIPVRIPPHATEVARYTQIAAGLAPTSTSLKAEQCELQSRLEELTKEIQAAKGDRAKWDALSGKVSEAEKAVNMLRSKCADKNGACYSVGVETALRKIMRDKLFEGEFGKPVRIELARNEFESAQIAVIANEQDLKKVSVSVSDVKGPGGALIPAGRVALNLVEFVRTTEPAYEVEYIGWYPDPLMDYAPFDVSKGSLRAVWITVHAPQKIPAGIYKGTVTVKPTNAKQTEIPIEVKVWDFDLPTTPHFKTAFAFMEDRYKQWYGKPITKEQRRQAYQLLLEHRINPTNIYSKKPQPSKEDIPFCIERGMNAFNLHFIGGNKNDKVRAEIAEIIRDYEKYLKQNGWWDKAYVYGFDEVGSGKYADVRDMFGWVKKEFPDLPRMCTVVPNPELKGSVDIWVPLVANLDYEEAQQYIKDGDQVWWYICCGPERPFPNWFVDYPAMDPRILGWMSRKYRVPGLLYWTVNRWQSQLEDREPEIQKLVDAGKRWPEIPWKTRTCASFNGDGHLVYPGPKGTMLSSVRLEAVRDGIDDYEYFYLLDSLVKKAENNSNADQSLLSEARKLLEVREDVVKSTFEYAFDPKVLFDARREVAEMIEKIKRS